MTERFHWDWKTGRMKDTYSSFQATKDMRLIERQVNDACNSYEKQIAKLEKENEQLKKSIDCQDKTIKEQCIKLDWASECGVKWEDEFKQWNGIK